MSGTSKLYSKKRFGYDHDKDGNLLIKESEASAVRLIFESYLAGYSILGLRKLLLEKGINSQTNKILWCKQSIEMILNNYKYTGDSIILDPEKPFHITELRKAIDAIIVSVNSFDSSSTFDIPTVTWLPIGTGRPRADVMQQIQNLILTL
ncbi:MAG: hypothetical protein GX971_07785 [Firmicutes bacterium]|nr:hypothetical protein [Bacillota bacterium]